VEYGYNHYHWSRDIENIIWTNEPRLMLLALLSATLAFVATIVTPSKKRVMAAAVAFAICAALEIAALARFQHLPEELSQCSASAGSALAKASCSLAAVTACAFFKRQRGFPPDTPSPAEPAGFTTHLPKLAGFAVVLLTAASLGACCKNAMS
jgi:hypothetical protein